MARPARLVAADRLTASSARYGCVDRTWLRPHAHHLLRDWLARPTWNKCGTWPVTEDPKHLRPAPRIQIREKYSIRKLRRRIVGAPRGPCSYGHDGHRHGEGGPRRASRLCNKGFELLDKFGGFHVHQSAYAQDHQPSHSTIVSLGGASSSPENEASLGGREDACRGKDPLYPRGE